MATGTINTTVNIAGLDFSGQVSRSADGLLGQDPELPAGKTGTLSTRTDDNTGIATLEADHGITTDDKVDVYWAGGVRYGMAVTNVATNDITIDVGAGDVLPAVDTALIVTAQVTINEAFDGDDLELLAAHCPRRAHLDFQESNGTSIGAFELIANMPWQWAANTGITNSLTGNPVAKIMASCGEASAGQLKIMGLYDSTP